MYNANITKREYSEVEIAVDVNMIIQIPGIT